MTNENLTELLENMPNINELSNEQLMIYTDWLYEAHVNASEEMFNRMNEL